MDNDSKQYCSICQQVHLSCATATFKALKRQLEIASNALILLEKAAFDCGTSSDNPDTCGVCHLHFAECEDDKYCVANENDILIGYEPACPGARVRAVLNGN
jgi:hypothetical protein